jgi:Xaa-Pro aminopeptidase
MLIKGVDWQLLTSRDEIMWLLNIRGNDLKYSPLLDSFCLVGNEQVILFAEEQKIPLKLASEFDRDGIVIFPYEETAFIMPSLTEGKSVLLNPVTTSVTLFDSVSAKSEIREDISIPSRLKAIKNKTEIDNLTRVMLRDGVALTRFLFWLESYLDKIDLSEKMLCDRILEFRSQQKDFLGPSFATIVSFNKNSALPHYSPSDASNLSIEGNGILLIDSGGQYTGGTTDITRTIAIGQPSAGQRKDFTLVLKGHINLARAKFPAGTRGYQLDILARDALWQSGLNYGHGTGHGIGYYLNVHEGPQSISPADNTNPIEPGMVLSNEPAIYREGEYGIRTENVILCYEDEETEFGKFLKFDTISFCYLDKNLIDKSILTEEDISWINTYHSEVFDKLSPFLPEEEKLWLKDKTEPL